jgi:hypothetical protein
MYCCFSMKIIEILIYDWLNVTTTCTKLPLINLHSVVLLRDGFFFILTLLLVRGMLNWTEAQPKANTVDRRPITRPLWNKSHNDACINKSVVQYLSALFFAIVETSRGFRSCCYWTDCNDCNISLVVVPIMISLI